jgi:hypothetical protein
VEMERLREQASSASDRAQCRRHRKAEGRRTGAELGPLADGDGRPARRREMRGRPAPSPGAGTGESDGSKADAGKITRTLGFPLLALMRAVALPRQILRIERACSIDEICKPVAVRCNQHVAGVDHVEG